MVACLLSVLQTSIVAILIRNALSVAKPEDKAAHARECGTMTSNPIADSRCIYAEIEEGPSDSSVDVRGRPAYGDNTEDQNDEGEDRRFIPDIFKVRRISVC